MPPKKKKASAQNGKIGNKFRSQASASIPQWPTILPNHQASDLAFEVLLQDQILTIPNFWTATLCSTYATFLATLPLTTTLGMPRKGDAVRVNDRFEVDDPAFAQRLWTETALEALVLNPSIAGTMLSEGDKISLWDGKTAPGSLANLTIPDDESKNIWFPSVMVPNAIPARTTWTLLIYLSSPVTGCIGGETVFYPEAPNKRMADPSPVIVDLRIGTALLHRHGRECLLHEGREVKEGVKWVIRSDLCVKR
nr:hypothetical protein CFP56_21328 [Quercus suber]